MSGYSGYNALREGFEYADVGKESTTRRGGENKDNMQCAGNSFRDPHISKRWGVGKGQVRKVDG